MQMVSANTNPAWIRHVPGVCAATSRGYRWPRQGAELRGDDQAERTAGVLVYSCTSEVVK